MIRKIRFWVETLIALFIGSISSLLSPYRRVLFGRALGRVLHFLLKKRREIAKQNLIFAFPEKSQDWVNETVRKTFENMGIVFAEFLALKWLDEEKIKDYVRFENVDLILAKFNQGNGVILLSGHYGNWEFLAYSVYVYLHFPVLIVVKPLSNYILDKIINRNRTRLGNKVVSMYESAFKVVKTLRSGGIVALLADQSATKDRDIFVDFFGRKAATFDSPAYFALKYNVPIIVGFARRENYYYNVKLIEIEHSDLNFNKEGIFELTRRYVELLENAIREQPELWLWTHRRWKHSPV